MADVKVQRGSFILGNGTASKTLTAGVDYTAPSAASAAFVRIISSRHHSMADFTNGGIQSPDDATVRIDYPSGDITDDIRFTRYATSGGSKVCWEIIEYTGSAGGPNEFIVRGVGEISFGYGEATKLSGTISGITSRSDCVPFLTYAASDGSINDQARHAFRLSVVDDSGNDKVQGDRNDTTGDPTKYAGYACVEFTGSNWSVQQIDHTYSNPGNEETEAITDVGALTRAFFHAHYSHQDNQDYSSGHEVYFNSTTQLGLRVDANASGNKYARIFVVSNSQTDAGAMAVQHKNGTRAGGKTDPDVWNLTVTEVAAMDATSVIDVTTRSEENYESGTIPVLAELTSTTNVELGRVESMAAADDIFYRVQVVEWPTAPTESLHDFRFFLDDGGEGEATPAQAQGQNHSIATGGKTRLRYQVKQPVGGEYQAELRLKGSQNWFRLQRP